MPLQVPVTQTGLEASIEAAAKKAGRNLQINLGTNAKSINSLSQPLGRITGQADEFTKSMEAANARVFAFGASVGIINGVSKAFGALVKSTIEVEKSLVEINSVLGASSDSLQKFGNKLFDVAKTTGQTFDVVAKGALELARQGLSTEETLKRINDALILSRLSGLDAQQSVEGLTAAFNSFKETGITTSQILNKLVVVSQKYSVSERDLIEGLKRSASVADQAGVSFDELVGIITTVQERTARGGAVIGNAFKTIFARIQDTGALQDLSNLGIQVTDLEGKILPATKILQNLGAEFNNLSQLEQADIAKKLGGVYQLSNLLAAVKDLSSEQSKYNDIVKLSAGATNEAYQKNAALNETLAALINKVSVSAQQLGATLGAIGITDNLKSLLGFFNNILEGIQNILGEESMLGDMFRGLAKGIGSVLAGPGLALFGAIVAKLSKDLISFGLESLKSFFKIGQASKEINALQGSIASTLLRNKDIQAQILSLEGNRVAQAKFFTTALNEQYLTMQKMQGIAASIAPAVYGGTRGGRGGTSKNAAGGYMPAVSQESRDISRGVGGAKSGDKPVVIPNFAFGGGKRGSMVAHTGEFIVPNFAAGGSAIFNRDMVRSMGLPAGAQKINAAGGFVPNFVQARSSSIPPNTSPNILRGYAAYQGNDPTSKQRAANAQKILDQKAKKKLPLDQLIPINKSGRDFAMIVGMKGVKDFQNRFGDDQGRITSTQTEKSRYLISVPIRGIQNKELQFKESKKINEELSEIAGKEALQMAKALSGGVMPNPDNLKSIKESLNPGALAGTAGTIFEAAISGILNDDDFKDYSKIDRNSLIDFPPFDAIKKLFGIKGGASKGLEAKATNSSDLISSAAGKFLKNAKGAEAFSGRGANVANALNKAVVASVGYIPNFADPLKEAIDREMSAGIPASQIYIDKNPSLKNSMNPMGLMVANRRDEPGGGMQGVSRARREGANPMTYGAASGFVPNFERRVGTGSRPPASLGGGGGSSDLEPVKRDFIGTILAIQTGLSFFNGATSDATSGLGKFANIAGSVASSAGNFVLLSQGLTSLLKTGDAASKVLGRLGVAGAVLAGGFELYKQLFIQPTKEGGKAIAKFSDAVNQAGVSIDNLSKSAQQQSLQGAEGYLKRMGFGASTGDDIVGRVYKDPETQKMFANAFRISGISEKDLTEKLVAGGALQKRELTGENGKSIPVFGQGEKMGTAYEYYGEDLDKTRKVLAEITAMPEKMIDGKINPEYEKRIKRILELKGEQAQIEKDINEPTENAIRLNTANISLLKQQLENRIAYKNALFEATSAEEYSLELQKEMLSVGEKERTAAGYKLQALQDAKKLTLEQEKATLDVLKNSELINKKLEGAGLGGTIDPTKFKEIAGISEEISDLIKQQGGYTQEVENKAQSLLAPIVKNKEQQDLILLLLKESNSEVEKRLTLESRLNALNSLKTATLEAEKFVYEKRSTAITNEYDQASKKAALDKNALDIELERFKIEKERQKIGGGAGGNLSVDRQILDKEKLTINAKLKIDQEDLLNQVRKTFAEAALQAGYKPEELSAISTATSQKEFEAIATAIEDAEKQAQKLKIDQVLEQVRIQNESVINQVTLTQTSAINFATTVIQAGQQVASYLGSIATNPFQLFGEEQKPFTTPISAMPPVNQAFEEAKQKLQGATEGAVKFAEAQKRGIDELSTNFSGLFDVYNNSVIESGQAGLEAANSIGNLENALLSAGGSLTTFANLVRGVFTSLPETIAQNQFSMLTATDSQSIIGNAVEARRNAILAQGPASAGTIAQAADATAIYEKELEIKRAITAEDKINGEFELEKLKEILPLRMELLKAETNEEREAIIDRIIAKEKQRLPVLDRIKAAMASTPEQRTQELEDSLVNASVQFRDNLIDGISKAVEEGGSLKDVLRSAALDFARAMTKAGLQNVAGQIGGLFGFAKGGLVPSMASGGMINGGSGSKDDVPAMLMGGEYVLKKTAVQKYGSDFLNALNNGRLGGYAKGGKVNEIPNQTGAGGFFASGLYDTGSIVGKEDLLRFATQSYTSGARDVVTSGENFASVNLEPESLRLTNFGRTNDRMSQATQSAKEEAFGLYGQQLQQEQDYKKQLEEYEKQKKAEKKALRNQLIMMAVSAAAGPVLGAAGAGFKAAFGAAGGMQNFLPAVGSGLKGIFTGGSVGGVNVGGLGNLFKGVGQGLTGNFSGAGNSFKLSQIGTAEQLQGAFNKSVQSGSGFSGFLKESGYTPQGPAIGVNGGGGGGGIFDWFNKIKSGVGGLFGGGRDIDAQGFEYTGEDIKDPSQWVRGGSSTAYDNGVLPPLLNGGASSDALPYLNDSDLSSDVPLNAMPVMSDTGKRAVLNAGNGRRYATGGAIPSTSGVDTIPTMLSGGEFIMNRAASQNIGAGNLQSLNAGASSLPTEEKTEELNDKLIAKLDELIEASSGGGNITINVESATGKTSEQGGDSENEKRVQMARLIKDMVLKVIQDEKRLGGALRRG